MSWNQPVSTQFVALTLFQDHPMKALNVLDRQNKIREMFIRVACRKQAAQITPRLNNGHRPSGVSHASGAYLRFVDQLLELSSNIAMALPGLVGGNLHSHRQEAFIFLGNMAAHQR